jgi:hypothetical protein
VSHARQHRPHLVDERTGVVLSASRRASQQRDPLPDLGTLEEALDAAQRERDAVLAERLLVHLGLCVDAEQHGHLAIGRATAVQLRDLVGDGAGLCRLVGVPAVRDGVAGRGLRL